MSLQMTPAERNARQAAKQRLILEFLATGETWTTLEIVQALLACTRWTARRTCMAMTRAHLLRETSLIFQGVKRMIYGITPGGCAELDLYGNDAYPHIEPPSPSQYEHHLALQHAHIVAMRHGWQWMPQRVINIKHEELMLRKRPDALATTPRGHKIAIEIERTPKSKSRYADVLSTHTADLKAERYAQVHYISPQNKIESIRRAFLGIDFVTIAGDRQKFNADQHLAGIRFFDFKDWPKPRRKAVQHESA